MTICIDSNVFLRLFVVDHPVFHKECLSFFKHIKTHSIKAVAPGIVFAEVCWTLSHFYGLSKHDVVQLLRSIIHFHGLTIVDEYDYEKAISLYERHSVKYIDAQIASIPYVQSKEWIIVSYDRDFDKLSVLRKEPADILHV